MKLSYSIDPVARVVEFHYTGSPDFAEWSAVMEAILADPAFHPGYGFLTDRRFVSEAPTTEYVQNVMAFLRKHQAAIGPARWAAVVSGPASYGMVRMAQHLGSELPFQIQVFTDEVMARRWLEEGGQERPFRRRR
jgi:hypothetical protein